MKSFNSFCSDINETDPCWDGYHMVGMKKKKGKTVPNCVPTEETIYERGADSKGYYRSTESGAGLTAKGAKHFGIHLSLLNQVS